MIVTVDELIHRLSSETDINVDRLVYLLCSLESMVRKETNNHFHALGYLSEMIVSSSGNLIPLHPHHFHVGDTIEVSSTSSKYNRGQLRVIKEITDEVVVLDKPLETEVMVLRINKVEYPEDVKEGVLNLAVYSIENGDKIGIKSESISRHSVTYFDVENHNKNGYPSSLMAFLKPYYKARF